MLKEYSNVDNLHDIGKIEIETQLLGMTQY